MGSMHNPTNYLRYLTYKGASRLYGTITTQLRDKIDYELKVIDDMGFSSYFLIVWDLINAARLRDIPVGPGRGSAGGAVVAYCLGITEFDPLEYDLIFERFLNPERPEMPDVDIDFCQYRRGEVVDYIIQRYGSDYVAQIMTYGTLKRNSLLENVGKVMKIGWDEVNRIKDVTPNEEEEDDDTTITDIYEQYADFRKLVDNINSRYPRFWETCLKLEGLHRNESKHAAGVIICDVPVATLVPLFAKGKKDAAEVDSSHMTVQLDKHDAEEAGLLKMDILGLRTLSVIAETVKTIRKHEPNFTIQDINLEDPNVYKMLRNGKTRSVFQLEGQGITSVVKRMHISSFNDIIALLALYRPGPLDAKMDKIYIDRKLGREVVTYQHPDLELILKPTWGVILYQEQVMRISMVMAGYSAAEADKLRKAMGKKDKDLMAKEKGKFIDRAIEKRYDKSIVEDVAHQIETFARYGFNKSHSTAYALITYRTAYLKCYYPMEYMSAEANSFLDTNDKLANVIGEIKSLGIPLLPPHINYSYTGFQVDNFAVRFGLTGIKGIGGKTVQAIIKERNASGYFRSFEDFCDRMAPKECNSAAKKTLILSGAFDIFDDRAYLIDELESRYNKKYIQPDIIKPMCQEDKIQHEKELLNFYVSGTPFSTADEHIRRFGATTRFDQFGDYDKGIAGILKTVRVQQSKKGQMAFITVESENTSFDCTVFSDVFRQYDSIIKNAEGKMVVIKGRYNEYMGKTGLVMSDIAVIERNNVYCRSVLIDLGLTPHLMTLAALKHECECSTGNTVVNILVHTGEEEVEIMTQCMISVTTSFVSAVEAFIGTNKISYGW
jgi:DNA polymerase-3 subunit alpha